MGIDITTYVGPFVECGNPLVATRITVRGCTNPSCAKYQQVRWDKKVHFCETCGCAIDRTFASSMRAAVSREELSDIDGPMTIASQEGGFPNSSKEVDIWINNLRANVGHSYDSKHENFASVVTPDRINEEIKLFEEQFATQLTRLREVYGPYRVEIKWGILNWLS